MIRFTNILNEFLVRTYRIAYRHVNKYRRAAAGRLSGKNSYTFDTAEEEEMVVRSQLYYNSILIEIMVITIYYYTTYVYEVLNFLN